jgi:DNA-directed RNA polymerase sigma subunit (sigma70/sigma32)
MSIYNDFKKQKKDISNKKLIELYLSTDNDKNKKILENILISNNINLIAKIVNRISRSATYIYEDLYQEAILIAINSIRKFDISKNINLSTYISCALKKSLYKIVNKEILLNSPLVSMDGREDTTIPVNDNSDIDPTIFSECLSILSKKELDVLKSIYRIDYKEKTLKIFEVLRKYHISKATFYRIKIKAENKIKKYYTKKSYENGNLNIEETKVSDFYR